MRHYCLDDGHTQAYKDLAADTNLFQNELTVRSYLPILMTMSITSIKSCGLDPYLDDELPSIKLQNEQSIKFEAKRELDTTPIGFNELCKLRIDTTIIGSDNKTPKEISFQFE